MPSYFYSEHRVPISADKCSNADAIITYIQSKPNIMASSCTACSDKLSAILFLVVTPSHGTNIAVLLCPDPESFDSSVSIKSV